MHAPRERPRLCGVTACRWTVNWACPGSSIPGKRGFAHDDGTHAFRCCCLLPPSLLPPPPPPAPPPPVFLQAFFGCERGTLEGDRVQLASSRTGDEEDTRWVVVKSRDVGEPAPRLCEAELQHRGTAQQRGQSTGLAAELGSCASSAAPGGSGPLETPRARGRAIGRQATALGARASRRQSRRFYRVKPFRRSCLGPLPVPSGLRCQACRAGRASTKLEPARRPVPSCIARRVAHLSSRARAA